MGPQTTINSIEAHGAKRVSLPSPPQSLGCSLRKSWFGVILRRLHFSPLCHQREGARAQQPPARTCYHCLVFTVFVFMDSLLFTASDINFSFAIVEYQISFKNVFE